MLSPLCTTYTYRVVLAKRLCVQQGLSLPLVCCVLLSGRTVEGDPTYCQPASQVAEAPQMERSLGEGAAAECQSAGNRDACNTQQDEQGEERCSRIM